MRLRILCAFALLTLNSFAWSEDWLYTLRPGDELSTIARDYCGSINKTNAIAQHNNLAPTDTLQAGQRIKIPVSWLAFAPSDASVEQVLGNAFISRRNLSAQQPLQRGDKIQMGDVLLTQRGAVIVRFADDSNLAIQAFSEVLFNKLTAFGPAGMVDTHLRFAYGRGKATVSPQNRGDRFRIQTPEGIAAVRGTVFRVGHKQKNGIESSNTETIEGLVDFSSTNQVTDLAAGFGLVASSQGLVKEALIDAPKISSPPKSIAQHSMLGWQASAQAAGYVISWALPSAPDAAIHVQQVSNAEVAVEIVPGNYIVRIRAISAAGIEGYDLELDLQVLSSAPQLQQVVETHPGQIAFQWQTHNENPSQSTLVLNAEHWEKPQKQQITGNSHTMNLAAGRYQWFVDNDQSAASAPQEFVLQPRMVSNVRSISRNKGLLLRWQAPDENEHYKITITGPNEFQQTHQTDDTTLELKDLDFGLYRVELASLQNSLQSETYSIDVKVAQRPWWLVLFISILAL